MHGDVMNTQQLMDPDRGKNVAKSDDDTKTTITRKKTHQWWIILSCSYCIVKFFYLKPRGRPAAIY
jgi:hypothetical protein